MLKLIFLTNSAEQTFASLLQSDNNLFRRSASIASLRCHLSRFNAIEKFHCRCHHLHLRQIDYFKNKSLSDFFSAKQPSFVKYHHLIVYLKIQTKRVYGICASR